ncbi:seryl-tRNA synthetase [Apophysomyces ossiformis]|uniref:serine--tRNA ligase n=1 Tax=Apophysomyces ossiformis TaxID=679940 RepID=A0A8H7C0K1_9FUNG|nr:seryl-tRNA synthetase [Apophysomyces ossiformis]
MLRHCLRCRSPTALRNSVKRLYLWPQRRCQASLANAEDDVHRIPPQLNYKYLADHAEAIELNMKKRNYDSEHARAILQLYQQRENILSQVEDFRAARDRVNQSIRSAKTKDERQQFIDEAKTWKERIRAVEEELGHVEAEMTAQALLIPNNTHPDVPVGPEENAKVIKMVGTKRTSTDFPLLDHLTLAERLDMLDFEQAALVSGSKFYYLKNHGVWLEFALIQYALEKAASRGFSPIITPDVVRTSIAYGCGFQPRKKEASQIYDVSTTSTQHTSAPKLCLAGTAEIPLAGLFAKSMPKEEELPKRVVGFGRAFRAEAGHGSAEERGLYRVHQFSKVELFAVTTPHQSEAVLEEFRELQEDLFKELGLCFRVLDMPTEELGASAYRKYDIEAWMPGRQAWGEISSTSNCTDYQTRRLDIRYLSSQFKENVGPKDVRVPWHIKEKWVDFCHTLNGTAMAVPRVIVALLETHQQSDGSIKVPQALRRWIPGQPDVLK